MKRRRFVSRLAAGVFAAAMVEDALLGRMLEPDPDPVVSSTAELDLVDGFWHRVETVHFGDGRDPWVFVDGRRVTA